MKAIIHPPVHESFQKHRRQRTWQIILPVVLASLVLVGLIVLIVNITLFQNAGDVARWAEVSTIWISIPLIIVGIVFFILLAGIAYLLIRLLQIAPTYTGKAQDFIYKISGAVKRAADAAVKPVIFLNSIGASIKALLGRE